MTSTLTYAKDDGTSIVIACIGPRDAYIVPIVIATDYKNYHFVDSGDSLGAFVAQMSVQVVSSNVYSFVEKYFKSNKSFVDTLSVGNFESTHGACVVYQKKQNENLYYMMACKEETVRFLTKFSSQLLQNKEFDNKEIIPLVARLESFIRSIKQ